MSDAKYEREKSCQHIGATKHRIGHIGVQIILLLDMTQYKVAKGKRLGSVLVKQFSRAQPG